MAGSVYTYVGNADRGIGTGAIEASQGTVGLRQSGLFLPAEYQAALGQGLLLKPGPAVSPVALLVAPVVAAGAAGNPNGAYRYVFTFVTAAGETIAGPEVSAVSLINQQGSISNLPIAPPLAGVIGRGIYRTVAGGVSGTEKLVARVMDNTTTTYLDNIADGSLGANVPSIDTAGVISAGGSLGDFEDFEQQTNKDEPSGYAGLDSLGRLKISEFPPGTGGGSGGGGLGINVMEAPYNAAGDGVTDDTTAISAAIVAAQAVNEPIFLPSQHLISAPLPVLETCRGINGVDRYTSGLIIDPTAVRTRWDGSTSGLWSPIPPAPSGAVAVSGSGLGVGTYKYRIAFQWQTTNSFGTTTFLTTYAGDEITVTTTSGNQKVNLSGIVTGPVGFVTRRLIYRTAVGGASGSEELAGTIEDNTTTTYSDTTPDGSLTSPAPICTTYHGPMIVDPCGANPGNNQTWHGHVFQDFSIAGNTSLWGRGGVQARMWQIDGIRFGANDTAINLNVQGMNAGYTIQGDHNNLYNCWGQINAKGLRHIAPNPADLGNNTFIGCKFDNGALCSVAVAPGSTTQGDLYAETHMGFSPYCLYKEGVGSGTHANQPLGEQFIDTCVFQMCFFESIGNGVAYDPSAQSIISNNVWEGLMGAGWTFITSGSPDVRNGNIYCIQSQPADWNFSCGGLAENRIIGSGSGFGPGNKGCFYAQTFFFDFYHDEARLAIDFINLNNAVLGGGPGAANNQVYAAAGSSGQLLDVKIRYNATEADLLPCTTALALGDVAFHAGVAASPGCSRSSGTTANKDQPVAGVALCASGSGQLQPGVPIVKRGFVAKANLITGLTLSTSQSPGGWLKPSGNDNGLITVANNKADYSIGYWTGGQSGQVASMFVDLVGGGALLTAPPFLDVGNGSDGAFTLDGVAVPAWATFSGGFYHLTRDAQCTDLTVNNGVLILSNGCRVLCSGNFNDLGATWSAAGGPGGIPGGGGGGIAGPGGNDGGGHGGDATVAGTNIINALGGRGGAGASAAAGTITPPSSVNGGSQPSPLQMSSSPVAYFGGSGGGGGATGGGGGGAGIIFIAAKNILSLGLYQAQGAAGVGGGGGGGGGVVYIAYSTKAATASPTFVSVAGGAGNGAGVAGAAGVYIFTQASLLADLDVRYGRSLWRPFVRSAVAVGAGGSVTTGSTVYYFNLVAPQAAASSISNSALGAIYIDPADLSPTGQLKLRIRGLVVPNAVAPGCDYLFQVAGLSAGNFGGPSGSFPEILSTTGALATVTVTAANVAAAVGGAGFPPHSDGTVTLTTAGWYVFIIRLSATPASGALSHAQVEVDYLMQ